MIQATQNLNIRVFRAYLIAILKNAIVFDVPAIFVFRILRQFLAFLLFRVFCLYGA